MARSSKSSRKSRTKTVHGESTLRRLAITGGMYLGLALFLFLGYCALTLPDLQEADAFKRKPSVTVLDASGSVIAEYGERSSTPVTLKDLPTHVPNAVMAVEDRRFYAHFGFDPIGFTRGVVVNPILGKRATGGSTITQQLAKNLFLTPDRNIKRKVQELMLSFWLEANYSKAQILEAYLNRVYFGAGAYGVEAAARTYFGKSARCLNIRESALLAGLLKAPSRYSPRNDADEAEARTKVVLASMEDAGFLSEAEQKALDKLPVLERHKLNVPGEGRYFADWVLSQTQDLVGDVGEDVVVKTTLNRTAQKAAEAAVKGILEREGADAHIAQAAVVLLGNDGAVQALVGGRDYQESQFNRATMARRQPGSAFKPFIYLAGLDAGITADTVFEDAPKRYGKWAPQNYDGKYRGPITVRQALAESVNTVAVQILDQAGIERARRLARRAGITSNLPHELSIALGSAVVTPIELTGAYAVIANDGQGVAPYAITEITGANSKVLYRHRAVRMPQLIDSTLTRRLTDLMIGVVDSGTGRGANFGRPIAGKTGTSSDYRDAWFVGFTGTHTLGVWMGNDDNKPMRKVTGGGAPARLWREVMAAAEANQPVTALHLPSIADEVPILETIENLIRGASDAPTDVQTDAPTAAAQQTEHTIVDNSVTPSAITPVVIEAPVAPVVAAPASPDVPVQAQPAAMQNTAPAPQDSSGGFGAMLQRLTGPEEN